MHSRGPRSYAQRFPPTELLKEILKEMVRTGHLVTVFDPECGEDRYCTPQYKGWAQSIMDRKAARLAGGD